MRIESVTVLLAAGAGGFGFGRNCIVEVRTDTGITGYGQSGTWAYPEAVAAVVESFRSILVGQDPLRIEHLWQRMYRLAPFRGNILHGAVSAVDIALWDIKGRHYQTPVWDLLGGRYRDRVRLYKLVLGSAHPPETVHTFTREAIDEGFTALKFDPVPHGAIGVPMRSLVRGVRDRVAAAREAAGEEVDLLLEFGRKLNPLQVGPVMEAVAEFHPLLVEDAVQLDSISTQARTAERAHLPMANGERLTSIWEYRELLVQGGPQYVRPDLGMGGGITHCRKIATLAEAFHSPVVSHNWLGPLLTAAAIHLDVTIPNFVAQEYSTADETDDRNSIFASTLRRDGGWMQVPDAPGLGVEVLPDLIARFPHGPIDWSVLVDEQKLADGSVGVAL